MARQLYLGTCSLCSHAAARAAMPAHLEECAPSRDSAGAPELLVQLLFEGADDPRYWLIIEARGSATLRQVDALLRRTWLECCGHMSAFRVGRAELSKSGPIQSVLRPGVLFEHDYDFGSTTTLRATALGGREGVRVRSPARILARNTPIAWTCSECPAPAALVCPFCSAEEAAVFCEGHARTHRCEGERQFLAVVDSPRMGVCGYGAPD